MQTQLIGRGMLIAACVLGMLMMTLFFGDVEERQRNPNQFPDTVTGERSIEVTLQRNRQGHYVTSGWINGLPVEFLLDTGATDVVVPERMARRLKLRKGSASRAMTANGVVTVYETRIDRLAIGAIELFDVRASINPGMAGSGILLGMSALREVEFVQRGDLLTLRQWRI